MKILYRIISAVIIITIIVPLWIVICILVAIYGFINGIMFHNFPEIVIPPFLVEKIGSTPPGYVFFLAKMSTLIAEIIGGFIENIKRCNKLKL